MDNLVTSKTVGGKLVSTQGNDRVDVLKSIFPDSVFFKTLTQNRHPYMNVMGATEFNNGYYPNNIIVNCNEKDFDPLFWLEEANKKLAEIKNNNPDLTTLALTTFKAKGTIGLSYAVNQDPICADSVPSRSFSVQTRQEGSTQYQTTAAKIFRSVAANFVVKKITTKDKEEDLQPNLANILGFILCSGLDQQWIEKSQNWFSMILNHLMNTHFRASIFKTYIMASKIIGYLETVKNIHSLTADQYHEGWKFFFPKGCKGTNYDLEFDIHSGVETFSLKIEIPVEFGENIVHTLLEHLNTTTQLGSFLKKLIVYIEKEYGKLTYKEMLTLNMLNDLDKPGSHKPTFILSSFPFVVPKGDFDKIRTNTKTICSFLTNMRNMSLEFATSTSDFIESPFSVFLDDETIFTLTGLYGLLSNISHLWSYVSTARPNPVVSPLDKLAVSIFSGIGTGAVPATTTGFCSIPHQYVRPLFPFVTKIYDAQKKLTNIQGINALCLISESAEKEPLSVGSTKGIFNSFPILDSSVTQNLPKRTKYLFPNYVMVLGEVCKGSVLCDFSGASLKFDEVKSKTFCCEVAKVLSDAFEYTLSQVVQTYQSKVVGLTVPDPEAYQLALEAEANLLKMIHTKTQLQNDFYILMQTMFSKDIISAKGVLNLLYNDAQVIHKTLSFLGHCFDLYHSFLNDFDDSANSDRDRILLIAPSVKKMIKIVLSEMTSYKFSGDILPYCDMQYTTPNYVLFSPALSCTRVNSLKYSTGGFVDKNSSISAMQISDFVEPVSTKISSVRTVENLFPVFMTTEFNSLFFKSCLSISYDSLKGEFNLTGKRNRPGNELFKNYTNDSKTSLPIFKIQPLNTLIFAENIGCTLQDLRVVTDEINREANVKILAIINGTQGKTQRVFWCAQGPTTITRTPTTEACKYTVILEKALQTSTPLAFRWMKKDEKKHGVTLLEEQDREVQQDSNADNDTSHEIFPKMFSFIPSCTQDSCYFKRTDVTSVSLKSTVLERSTENLSKDVTTTHLLSEILKEYCSVRTMFLEEKGEFSFSGSTSFSQGKVDNEEKTPDQPAGNSAQTQITDSMNEQKEETMKKEGQQAKKEEAQTIKEDSKQIADEDPKAHGNVAFGIDLSDFTKLSEAVDTIKVEVGESVFDITKIKKSNTFK